MFCRVNRPYKILLSFHHGMATYTIETRFGIYQIHSPATNRSAVHQTRELVPDIFKRNPIHIYSSRDEQQLDAVHQSLQWHRLEQRLQESKINFFKGFIQTDTRSHATLKRSIVLLGNDASTMDSDVFADSNLSRSDFQWMDNNVIQSVTQTQQKQQKEKNDSDGDEDCLIISRLSTTHPLFFSEEQRPIYKSYGQVVQTFRKLREADISPSISKFCGERLDSLPDVNKRLKHPFIVVEGLDGTGKSTMTKNLSKYFNAVSMATVPPEMRYMMTEFNKLPELCRRSLYAFSNYVVSRDVERVTDERPVVLDRYWHSTTAYAIASATSYGSAEHLPQENDDIYEWPSDLLNPTAVILLKTAETVRDARVQERAMVTREESKLAQSEHLRKRVLESYRRINFSKWIEVETSGTQEESLRLAVDQLKKHGVMI